MSTRLVRRDDFASYIHVFTARPLALMNYACHSDAIRCSQVLQYFLPKTSAGGAGGRGGG